MSRVTIGRMQFLLERCCTIVFFCLSGILLGCSQTVPIAQSRAVDIQQNWELEPGQVVAGYRISAGLGDISIEVGGDALYAPFSGTLQSHQSGCVIFSSPEVPAYLLRLCGIQHPKLGERQRGDKLGTGKTVHVATLRKQPTGQWAIVEPAADLLERILAQPAASPTFD